MIKSLFSIVIPILLNCTTFAQSTADTIKGQLHDDLLNELVGKWKVTSVAHGFSSSAGIEAEWVLNHQFLHYHFIGNDTIPWINKPMEFESYVSYNHNSKRYVILGMSVFGVDDFEGFCYGYRNGNELKLIQQSVNKSEPTNIQRWIWNQADNSWAIPSTPEMADGKEGEVFLDMKLTKAN